MKCILIARTWIEKTLGLSVFPNLKNDQYIVFEYPDSSFNMFWNKNVPYAIDIGFYNKDKKLIYKTELDAEQLTPVGPNSPYWYVVETKKGFLSNVKSF